MQTNASCTKTLILIATTIAKRIGEIASFVDAKKVLFASIEIRAKGDHWSGRPKVADPNFDHRPGRPHVRQGMWRNGNVICCTRRARVRRRSRSMLDVAG